eukprot:Rhum_TRINITY_DN12987_c0_g1::Rhum_TRINITY_DN12987_c0_g1_i1::g.55859::m.55859
MSSLISSRRSSNTTAGGGGGGDGGGPPPAASTAASSRHGSSVAPLNLRRVDSIPTSTPSQIPQYRTLTSPLQSPADAPDASASAAAASVCSATQAASTAAAPAAAGQPPSIPPLPISSPSATAPPQPERVSSSPVLGRGYGGSSAAGSAVPLARAHTDMVSKAAVVFRRWDTDQDGRWNYGEARCAVRDTEGKDLDQEAYVGLCAAWDTDPQEGLAEEHIQRLYAVDPSTLERDYEVASARGGSASHASALARQTAASSHASNAPSHATASVPPSLRSSRVAAAAAAAEDDEDEDEDEDEDAWDEAGPTSTPIVSPHAKKTEPTTASPVVPAARTFPVERPPSFSAAVQQKQAAPSSQPPSSSAVTAAAAAAAAAASSAAAFGGGRCTPEGARSTADGGAYGATHTRSPPTEVSQVLRSWAHAAPPETDEETATPLRTATDTALSRRSSEAAAPPAPAPPAAAAAAASVLSDTRRTWRTAASDADASAADFGASMASQMFQSMADTTTSTLYPAGQGGQPHPHAPPAAAAAAVAASLPPRPTLRAVATNTSLPQASLPASVPSDTPAAATTAANESACWQSATAPSALSDASACPAGVPALVAELQSLAGLYERRSITAEEFAAAKALLLNPAAGGRTAAVPPPPPPPDADVLQQRTPGPPPAAASVVATVPCRESPLVGMTPQEPIWNEAAGAFRGASSGSLALGGIAAVPPPPCPSPTPVQSSQMQSAATPPQTPQQAPAAVPSSYLGVMGDSSATPSMQSVHSQANTDSLDYSPRRRESISLASDASSLPQMPAASALMGGGARRGAGGGAVRVLPGSTEHIERFRDRLMNFFHEYRPERLPSVMPTVRETLLREDEVFAALVARYGPEPYVDYMILPLRAGWVQEESVEGDVYYSCAATGEKRWRRPM